jgi:hypothetical protein
MTQAAEPGTTVRQSADQSSVSALRRPPVRQSATVRSNVRHTFETFVATIGSWWPVQPFSAGQDRVCDITVEQRLGGRVYETWRDGTEVDWGTLQAWDPPRRWVMTWTFTSAPTEVEFTFVPLGPELTRVSVEHRGWEALSEEQLTEDCALPGGYRGGAYSAGWATILQRLAASAEAAPGRASSASWRDSPSGPRA